MSQYKLKRKFVLAQLITLLPLMIFIFFILDHWSDVTRQTYLFKNYQLTLGLSGSAGQLINHTSTLSLAIAQDPALKNLDRENALSVFFRFIPSLPYSSNLFLTDKEGNCLVDFLHPQETTPSASFKNMDFFREMKNTKTSVLSDLKDSPDFKNPQIYVSSPVNDQFGRMIGSVIISFPASVLNNYLALPKITNENMRYFLLDSNQEIILDSDNKIISQKDRRIFVDDPVLKPIINKNERDSFDGFQTSIFKDPVTGITAPVTGTGWYIMVTSPSLSQQQPIFFLQTITIAILFFTFVLSILTTTFFIHRYLSFL